MKTIVTISGIRPDFIRMSEIFKKLDQEFNHILIHTGQHYDKLLSDVFFEELNIREPDFILNTGKESSNHYEQLSYLSTNIPKLFKKENINPDLIIFLGDSNTVGVSFPLKKEGYKIGHIEAGMRSFDKRMLEEINRTVCDHCSDILFVYHDEYKKYLEKENIMNNVFVVGNTIVEPCNKIVEDIMKIPKRNNLILMDIHRPENFKHPDRLLNLIKFGNLCCEKYDLPVKLLYFKRLNDILEENNIDLGKIKMVDLMSFKTYLNTVYHCKFIISDSGTGQEEPALLNTAVIVPRDYSERPQSYENNCSIKLEVDKLNFDAPSCDTCDEIFKWIDKYNTGVVKPNIEWLGTGNTSTLIIEHLKSYFK